MLKKTNPKLLWQFFLDQVMAIYGYFLIFYVIIMIFVLISGDKDLFYWPGLNLALVILTILFFVNPKTMIIGKEMADKPLKHRYFLKLASMVVVVVSSAFQKPDALIKFFSILGVLIISIWFDIGVFSFLILAYGLFAVLFLINSRITIILAMISLIICAGLLIFNKNTMSEAMAIYIYYFLIITVFSLARENFDWSRVNKLWIK